MVFYLHQERNGKAIQKRTKEISRKDIRRTYFEDDNTFSPKITIRIQLVK